MVLAGRLHHGRLQAVFAGLGPEAHLVADLELSETVVGDAVGVEIDVALVHRLDEAVALRRKQPRDPAARFAVVRLDFAAPAARHILEPSRERVEGIAHGDFDVLVRVVLRGVAVHRDLAAGNLEVDADLVELALAVMPVRRAHHDAAAHDAAVEAFEPFGKLADTRPHRGRGLHVAERDLDRNRHGGTCADNAAGSVSGAAASGE